MKIKKNILIRQQDNNDCAPACLAMISYFYGKQIEVHKLKEMMYTQREGTVLTDIVDTAEEIGFNCKPIRVDKQAFQEEFTLPAIGQVLTENGLNHFVVIKKIYKNKVILLDPAEGKVSQDIDEFFERFTGLLILFKPNNDIFSKEDSHDPNKKVFTKFLGLLAPHKTLLLFVIFASILITLGGIITTFFHQIIIDTVIPNGLTNQLMVFTALFVGLALIQILITFVRSQLAIYISQKMDISLVLSYFKHIYNLPLKFFSTKKTGDIITRFSDSLVIKSVLTNLVLTVFLDLVLAIATGIILYNISRDLFLVISIITLINIVIVYLFKAPFKKYNLKKMQQDAKLNSSIVESINSISFIKSSNIEIPMMKKIEEDFIRTLKTNFKIQYLGNLHNTFTSTLMTVGNFILLSLGALMVIQGNMTVGLLLTFIMLTSFFMDPINRLVNMQLEIQEADISMKRLSEIMDYKQEELQDSNKEEFINLNNSINFKNVSFGYRANKMLISNFDLHINKGEKIALIGTSGSGKSTIANLLLGLYELHDGHILLDGVDIKNYELTSIRQRIGYIQQDVQLLPGTVFENLTLGQNSKTIKDIQTILDKIGLPNFIQSLDNGYETNIEESGVGLSGGEKQILSLVRCLLKRPNIIVMDEATSNLDPLIEKKVMANMYKNFPDQTFIIIAHDLSIVEVCNKIVVMNRGKISEIGTHDELISDKKEYYKLKESQNKKISHFHIPVNEIKDGINETSGVIEY